MVVALFSSVSWLACTGCSRTPERGLWDTGYSKKVESSISTYAR